MGSADRALGSGHRRSARMHENIQVVEELICSQEGQPITYLLTSSSSNAIHVGNMKIVVVHV